MGQGYVAAHPQVDILFIMDNSGSMVEEQDHLAENFEIFIREFSSRNIDFNLGVISSDALPTKDADEMGYPHYWSNEGVDAWGNAYVGFHSQGPGTLLSRDARHMFITEEMEISRSIELFKKNIKLGVNGNGAETPLLSLQRALLSTSPSMMRFFRPKSLLSIIFVTDEDESMSPTDARYLRENPHCYEIASKRNSGSSVCKKG